MSEKQYITVVLEYPKGIDPPRIGRDTTYFGQCKVKAIQFNDALEELQALLEDEQRDS